MSHFGVSDAQIAHAAELIRAGRLVAFPTETVYGLGANALDPAAVERIYEAKGRPHSSPIIIHVSDLEMVQQVVADVAGGGAEAGGEVLAGAADAGAAENLPPYRTW